MRQRRAYKHYGINTMVLNFIVIMAIVSCIKVKAAVDNVEDIDELQEKQSGRMMWFSMQNPGAQPQVVFSSAIPETLEAGQAAETANYSETANFDGGADSGTAKAQVEAANFGEGSDGGTAKPQPQAANFSVESGSGGGTARADEAQSADFSESANFSEGSDGGTGKAQAESAKYYGEDAGSYYDDSDAVLNDGAHGKDVLYGHYELIVEDAGIASMHTAVTRYDTVVMLDRTNIGPSHIKLPNGRCRDNPQELALKHDCTAHSVMLTPGPNTIRPLFIFTDTWCSSAQFLPDGTLIQTGGDFEGKSKIRRLVPCPASDSSCDWYEFPDISLQDPRWYATNQLLPDGRVIIVGGRSVFTYEFFPRPQGQGSFYLKFLADTSNFEADNLYPFVHLLPDGNLYIFANRDSILLDYKSNKVLRNYPTIPGNPRNYPSAGSSVLLPLDGPTDDFTTAEVLVCGGAQLGAFAQPTKQLPCSDTCGRMTLTSPNPSWEMETMPMRRCMGDMILLPNRDVVIINGAQDGSQGWGDASNPSLNPVIYRPRAYPQARFVLQPAGTIPRLYHSTANLLSDGSVLIAGSNTHQFYTFNGDFPTELRVEKWLPFYFNKPFLPRKPTIVTSPIRLTYGLTFDVIVSCQQPPSSIEINLISSYFSTHSYSQGQRLLRLKTMHPIQVGKNLYKVTTIGPPNANVAPPTYYMMFAVVSSVPSSAKWVQIASH